MIITDAQLWALRYIASHKTPSPAALGQHMSERPGMGRSAGRGQVLHKSQGFGRLGAKMMRLLERNGFVTTWLANGGYYMTAGLTQKGRDELKANAMTLDQIKALQTGDLVRVTWSGGNGPHVYKIDRDDDGTIHASSTDANIPRGYPGQLYNPATMQNAIRAIDVVEPVAPPRPRC